MNKTATKYPPGFFTELVFKHRFPPRFEPQCVDLASIRRSRHSFAAGQAASERAARGEGWGGAFGNHNPAPAMLKAPTR